MATIILRPSSDVSLSHTCSSGKTGYALVNEVERDDDATYIYQTVSSTTSTAVSTIFGLASTSDVESFRMTSIRVCVFAKTTGTDSTLDYAVRVNGTLAGMVTGIDLPPEETEEGVGGYADLGSSFDITGIASLYKIFDRLSEVNFELSLDTSGAKTNTKTNNFQNRITQAYIEITYETVRYSCSAIGGSNIKTATVSKTTLKNEEECTFTATVDDNSVFCGWFSDAEYYDIVSNQLSYTIPITANTVLYAMAISTDDEYYTVSSFLNGNGQISPMGNTIVIPDRKYTVHIYCSKTDLRKIEVSDNGLDVTSAVTDSSTEIKAMEIVPIPQATYGFSEVTYSGETYWKSANNIPLNTMAIVELDINVKSGTTGELTLDFINYNRANSNYMFFGKLDVDLGTVESIYSPKGSEGLSWKNNNSGKLCELLCYNTTYNKNSIQTLTYRNITPGKHIIHIGYLRSGSSQNNNAGYFRVSDSKNLVSEYGIREQVYTIPSVTENHQIVVKYLSGLFVVSNEWKFSKEVYKKENGTWIKCNPHNYEQLFNDDKLKVVLV